MRGWTHRWTLAPTTGGDAATAFARAGLGARLDPLVQRFLWSRGLTDPAAAAVYLDPRLTALHNPSTMPDLDRAAERLLRGVRAGERVVIYGDYDVDGICASAILFHTLRAIAGEDAPISTYVPHRLDEGYGLHVGAIEQLAGEGARVIVSVDCGITATAPALRARELGVDLIITDHHSFAAGEVPGGATPVPEAYAVVHPRRRISESAASYPFGELCGAGVAFKLAWRLATLAHGTDKLPTPTRELLLDLLALAAMATIADIVPLIDENRIIARFGLARLKHCQLAGVRALLEASGLQGDMLDADHAGFALGPRLNACGRMGHAREAVEMLTVASFDRAREIARELNRHNDHRRTTERAIADQAALAAVDAGMTGNGRRAIVLAHEQWHPGVVGIVCSRLVGLFQRPTILMQRAEGMCQGSGRSIDGFDLHSALSRCAPMLERFGGHEMAAGLALSESRLEEFTAAMCAIADEMVTDEMLIPSLRVDCEATPDELTPTAVGQLTSLGPFGRSNPRPSLMLRGLELIRSAEPLGQGGKHLALMVRSGGRGLRLVAWNWGERRADLRSGMRIDAVVCPKLNTWNGRSNVEAEVRDLCPTVATGTTAPVLSVAAAS